MTYLFIINPFAGKSTLSDHLRENIHLIDTLQGKEVLIFNSEYSGHETNLVNQVMRFLPDEDFFICVCAGSGSFHYVLNANLNFDKVKLTHFACGSTNDSLKFLGTPAISHFTDIKKLISGTTLYLDYIKTSAGNSFNTVSCGYSSKIIEYRKKLSLFSMFNPSLLWFIAGFFGIISHKVENYEITIDDKNYDGYYHEVICANGNTQGSALFLGNEIVPYDGLINFILIPKMNIFSLIKTIMGFYFHNPKLFNKKVKRFVGKTFSIKEKNNKPLKIDFDGELKNASTIHGEIVASKLPFVVPQNIGEKYTKKRRIEDEQK